jgi:abortive infection bacteriophage resistance protein
MNDHIANKYDSDVGLWNAPGVDWKYLQNSYVATEPCSSSEVESQIWFYDPINQVFFSHVPFRRIWFAKLDDYQDSIEFAENYIWTARDKELRPNPLHRMDQIEWNFHSNICTKLPNRNGSNCWHKLEFQQNQDASKRLSESEFESIVKDKGVTYESHSRQNTYRFWYRESNLISKVSSATNGKWVVELLAN